MATITIDFDPEDYGYVDESRLAEAENRADTAEKALHALRAALHDLSADIRRVSRDRFPSLCERLIDIAGDREATEREQKRVESFERWARLPTPRPPFWEWESAA